jgi:hypothetical protein
VRCLFVHPKKPCKLFGANRMISDVTSMILKQTQLMRSERDGLELGRSMQRMDIAMAET